MCNPFKAVKKVFKKIVGSTIGRIVLSVAVGFITFGLGAAIGLTASLTSTLGQTLGLVLSRALTGALAGAIMGGLTGTGIGKGALLGGIGGAILGGVESYIGGQAAGGVSGDVGPTGVDAPVNAPGAQGVLGVDAAFDQVGTNVEALGTASQLPTAPDLLAPPTTLVGGGGAGPVTVRPIGPPGTAPAAGGLTTPSALGSLVDKFLPSDPEVRGRLLGGAAEGALKGLMAGNADEATAEAYRARTEAQQAELATVRASHSNATRGLLTAGPQPAAPAGAVTPAQRFSGSYYYNPQTRRIEFQQAAAA